jgi:protein tyrosine phosphatase (PTP) superfamily phosphohydrolase (DUF442 family)
MSDTSVNRPTRGFHKVIVGAILAIVIGTGFLVWRYYFETYHLVVVDPGKLYRDGNRSLREFKNTLRKTNARTVVAIIDQQEYNEPEFIAARELTKSRGLKWIWIPIKAGAYPRPEQVREFLAIATDPARQPVLYHDDEGIRRAGMMMAAYQESVLGYDDARAKAAIQAFGHSDRTIEEVRRFIDAYDPVKGLTVDLNVSSATSVTTITSGH